MFEIPLTAKRQRVLSFLCVLCILAGLFSAPVLSSAQGEAVRAFWEINAPPERGWTVGDPMVLQLRAIGPKGVEVVLPELPARWGDFEVQSQTLLEPVQQEDGQVSFTREASVTLWAPGTYETPEIAITGRDADGETLEISVSPLSITVVSVLGEEDLEKHDLKPQASLPRPPAWPWIVGGVLAAALLFLAGQWLWRRLHRRRFETAVGDEVAVDDRPPEEIAYEKLDRIAALDLPAQGQFKRHYTMVTECVRTYLEGRYDIPALDRTTGELMIELRRARIDGKVTVALRALMQEADLAKFARSRPPVAQARDAVARARRLVDVTRPDRTAAGNEGEATAP